MDYSRTISVKIGDKIETYTGKEAAKWRRLLKKMYKTDHGRARESRMVSMMGGTRRRSGAPFDWEDWEHWTEYGIFNGANLTDDEVREILEGKEYHIYSPYDCTGKPFTSWIDWHRNPTGLISFIHVVGLDV